MRARVGIGSKVDRVEGMGMLIELNIRWIVGNELTW